MMCIIDYTISCPGRLNFGLLVWEYNDLSKYKAFEIYTYSCNGFEKPLGDHNLIFFRFDSFFFLIDSVTAY